jgi:uncharacterized membrane protein YfcA
MVNELTEILTTNPELLRWAQAQLTVEFKTALAVTVIAVCVTVVIAVIAWLLRKTVNFDGIVMLLIVPVIMSAISAVVTIHYYYQLQNPGFAVINKLIEMLN